MIEIADLRHAFRGREVLRLPEWRVADGASMLVLGASGSGKSTLLNILAGVLRPDEGRVEIAGRDIAVMSEAARDKFRGEAIGVVFQSLHLIPALSVYGNIRLASHLSGKSWEEARAQAMLERLGVSHRANAKPRALSRGEAQRAAIARALITKPKLLLADEPTSALDDANAREVVALLREEASALGATMVIATHDARLRDAFENQLVLEARG